MRGRLLAAIAAASLSAASSTAQEPAGENPLVISLADGTTFPLRPWSLSYEVSSWKQGTSPAFATIARVDSKEIWLGKKIHPTTGATLEIQYDEVQRERDVDGETKMVRVPLVRAMILVGPDGKKTTLKPEPPSRDLVMPGADKSLLVQPRSLDLRGQTLTGTKREFCLVSFTTLVECTGTSGQQVVKIQFQK